MRPYKSIREQLEGRVEDSYKPDQPGGLQQGRPDRFGAMQGQADRSSGLQGRVNDSGGRFHASLGEGYSRLQGKVEQRDLMGHLYRPMGGDPLGKSVTVLNGQNYTNPLQGKAEDDSLDSVLKASNFNLPLQRMTPKSDYNALSSNNFDLQTGRGRMQPTFSWGIGGWGVGSWGTDGWGIDEWPRYGWDAYRWQNGIQSNIGWDNMSFNQQRVRADLRLDPNFYQRPFQGNNRIPSISDMDTGWGIQPMARPQPLYADQNILWDAWYRQISNALYRNWNGRGQDPGLATLRITVRKNRRIEAQIVRCNNKAERFKKGLMDAVASLNGSAVLDFPNMSQRELVTFNSEFNASTDTARGAYSERSGEVETIRTRQRSGW